MLGPLPVSLKQHMQRVALEVLKGEILSSCWWLTSAPICSCTPECWGGWKPLPSCVLGWSWGFGPGKTVSMLTQEIWKLDLIIQQWLNSESCLVIFRYTETQGCISLCPYLAGSSLWSSPDTTQSLAMEVENSSEVGDRAELQFSFVVLTCPSSVCSFPGWFSKRLFYRPPPSNQDIRAGIESQTSAAAGDLSPFRHSTYRTCLDISEWN